MLRSPIVVAPVLETERLNLRPHRPEDLDRACALWGDPEVTRFIGGRPSTREEVWARLLRYAGLWSWFGFGYWALEERATGRFVGECGFADFQRAIATDLRSLPEIGWALTSDVHGRGLGTEAVQAAVTWADERFQGGATWCLVDPGNEPSRRLAAKVGYREIERTTYHGAEVVLLRR